VAARNDARVTDSNAPATEVSDELRHYPGDLLQAPLDLRTASFTFSPTAPKTTTDIFFNGSPSTAQSGATITSYTWDFGDGTTAVGVTPPAKRYASAPFTYVVRLTVTDSKGASATTTQNVSVVP